MKLGYDGELYLLDDGTKQMIYSHDILTREGDENHVYRLGTKIVIAEKQAFEMIAVIISGVPWILYPPMAIQSDFVYSEYQDALDDADAWKDETTIVSLRSMDDVRKQQFVYDSAYYEPDKDESFLGYVVLVAHG